MSERLREQQYTLARHLRDPVAHAPPPGLEPRRLRVYRELFFNNIRGLLGNGFPVIAQTLGEARWTELVHGFYAEHRAQTPLFARIAAEFVAYVEARGGDGLPPWLPELAHYEWVEQALYVSDAQPPAHDPQGDLLNGIPVLSPLALPLAYRWPVAEIGPDRMPDTAPAEPTLLLVHRGIDHQVRFARIAPLVYRLLVGMQSASQTGRQHLAALAAETGDEPAQFIQFGLPLLQQLHAQGVVLGTHIPTEQNHAV
ncbi:putative DNA-binding domain-containing protein [Lysobacter sp. 5GHs7-4]|uniref:HvfC family RiPP maturation protein n=1 Tax=Lysobacter sp. 5GHs7-4 TaxID=2904253 RepID=UPI001E4F3A13|nr:putative DNA-binding domain-containing protein [Lysobacter sp. 5GHs7-4]UHQ21420.1 putative DNA-binding domain-containing protein [Lysobacter sp. 5GHs7-4]